MNGKQAKKLRKRVKTILERHNVPMEKFRRQYRKAKKALVAGLIMLLFCVTCYADTLQIPVACYPIKMQQAFSDAGYKLDLSGNDRTEDSWGFIENRGTYFFIHTYRSVKPEDFEVIQQIVFRETK